MLEINQQKVHKLGAYRLNLMPLVGSNGKDGTNGLNSLVLSVNEPVGNNCTNRRTKIITGTDSNINNILDDLEVTTCYF